MRSRSSCRLVYAPASATLASCSTRWLRFLLVHYSRACLLTSLSLLGSRAARGARRRGDLAGGWRDAWAVGSNPPSCGRAAGPARRAGVGRDALSTPPHFVTITAAAASTRRSRERMLTTPSDRPKPLRATRDRPLVCSFSNSHTSHERPHAPNPPRHPSQPSPVCGRPCRGDDENNCGFNDKDIVPLTWIRKHTSNRRFGASRHDSTPALPIASRIRASSSRVSPRSHCSCGPLPPPLSRARSRCSPRACARSPRGDDDDDDLSR